MLDAAEDPLGEQRLPATAALGSEAPGEGLEACLKETQRLDARVPHRDPLAHMRSVAAEVGDRHGDLRPLAREGSDLERGARIALLRPDRRDLEVVVYPVYGPG